MIATPTATAWTSLDRLTARCCATVRAIDAEDEDSQRLKMLGLCVGRQVEVLQPGRPLIVRVFASRIGLAQELAARVHVEPCGSGCHCPVLTPAPRP